MNATIAPQEARMEDWQHGQYLREFHDTFKRVNTKLSQIQSDIGKDPCTHRRWKVAIKSISDHSAVQAYIPGYGVAGQGRCMCEAVYDAMSQLESLVDCVSENRDWKILPEPDNSVFSYIAVLKTNIFASLIKYLHSNFSAIDACETAEIKSTLSFA